MAVVPEDEERQIDIWMTFGWELFSTQEIHDTSTHLEQSLLGDTLYSIKETKHYVKLAFIRRRANVPEVILKLEDVYNRVPHPGPAPKTYPLISILMGMLILIPGVYMLVKTIIGIVQRPKWMKKIQVYNARRHEIYKRAKAYWEEIGQ